MWLIIGCGNILRGDDGAGYRLAEQLLTAVPAKSARVLAVHQLTPELALDIASEDIDRVLFLDINRYQHKPVVVRRLSLKAASGSCGHQLSPELLLQMAAALYDHLAKGWLLTIAAEQTDFGGSFSASTTTALPEALTVGLRLTSGDCCKKSIMEGLKVDF